MVICVASYKGGVGKTTTVIHLAQFFQESAPTLVLDGDPNRSCLRWAGQGRLSFKVVDERQAAMHIKRYEHVLVDTQARPGDDDIKALAGSCDLLILPTTPESLSLQALELTLETLYRLGAANYRVLLTMIPPRPNRDGEEARAYLESLKIPLFRAGIRRVIAFSRAALEGTTVQTVDRTNLGWADYVTVGEEIVKIPSNVVA